MDSSNIPAERGGNKLTLEYLNHRIETLCGWIRDLEQKTELPKLMTPKQVCDFVGISESKFYEWKRDGDVPPAIYWSERTVRYDRDDVIAWAESHKVGGAV